MKYWLDTEFIEDGKTIDLISIGIVAEDGRDHYFQSVECDHSKANDWVRENVIAHLEHIGCGRGAPPMTSRCYGPDVPSCPWRSRSAIAAELIHFCDWVAICQLFGRMIDLPKGWPMYCRDLKQWCDDLGNPRLPEQGKGEHHALADAQWNLNAWRFLKGYAAADRALA